MTNKLSFTDVNMCDDGNKILLYLEKDQLHVSNQINPKYISFFKEIMPEHGEIVYFEHDTPVCPECGTKMDLNGSRQSKLNMIEGILKKQYVCPECRKTKVTSLNDFIPENCNYSFDIAEKGLKYSCFGYLPYEVKSEIIELENDVEMNRQTVYYLESKNIDKFLK